MRRYVSPLCLAALLLAPGAARAVLDLREATAFHLDNGLTVYILEAPAFPLVSVQMVYRAGARDEPAGRSGLAHFVEHMAFRGSENFPDNGLVNSIYAVGGEWHGYTYIDQTTYFATVPAAHLGLLLRIEADRMSRLELAAADVAAERGAVLAELHGYENDPAAVLHDAATYVALLAHPYRNNTIGWESDVRQIAHPDLERFYARHYQPGNAVLAVVGDVDTAAVIARVRALFADIEGRPPSALPTTPEPVQTGERRLRLNGPVGRKYFHIAWPAPAANDADFAGFLVLQELLSASGGVNFLQNDWGTPARPGSLLDPISDDASSWMMPTAQPYVFVVKGSIGAGGDEDAVESAVADAAATLASAEVAEPALRRARERVIDELALDVQTTEDAAHQLAFFAGIDALDELRQLPGRIDAVSAADVRRLAAHYLDPRKRTTGWSVPGETPAARPAIQAVQRAPSAPRAATADGPAPPPTVETLSNGLTVVLQASALSPTVHLQLVLPGRMAGASLTADEPIDGVTAFNATRPAAQLPQAVAAARQALDLAAVATATAPSSDPAARAAQLLDARMSTVVVEAASAPLLIVLAGDFDRDTALRLLESAFGNGPAASLEYRDSGDDIDPGLDAHIDEHRALAHLAYVVAAPRPRSPAADAWQALTYILSHDYAGRLGTEAISRRGLAYYIDSRYRSNGRTAWVTLSVGVDPDKLDALRELLAAELARLRDEPPTPGEVAEALAHRAGRAVSAAQSNSELSTALATQWLWYGTLLSPAELGARLSATGHDDVLAAIDAFTGGDFVTVSVQPD